MGRGFTIEDVRKKVEFHGCKLLSDQYKNNTSTIKFICSCGQIAEKRYRSFSERPKCSFRNHDLIIYERENPNEILQENTFMKQTRCPKKKNKTKISSEENVKTETSWLIGSEFVNLIDKIHGKNKINCENIDLEKKYSKKEFLKLKCKICEYEWKAGYRKLIKEKKGCDWCRNKCQKIPKNSLYIVNFMGTKIHEGKYDYSFNKPENINSTNDEINIWCKNEEHKVFRERIGKHLSVAKKGASKGCPECNKTKQRNPPRIWCQNKELFIIESKKIHGNIFDYDHFQKEDIVNSSSKILLKCKNIDKNGKECGAFFRQKIADHINSKAGCPHCGNNYNYDYDIFIRKFKKRYGNEFLTHLIKKEDIVNSRTIPKIVCSVCGFDKSKTTVNDLLNSCVKKKCDRCNNCELWNAEKLKNKCKEKESIYEYHINFEEENNRKGTDFIEISCLICKEKGYEKFKFRQIINDHFNNGRGCPRCGKRMTWDYTKFLEEIEFLPLSFRKNFDYNHVQEKDIVDRDSIIKIKCLTCKNFFEKSVYRHIRLGESCSFCSKSHGSKKIYLFLKFNNIPFEEEAQCFGSKTGGICRYDYKLDYKGQTFIIEYDGKQHFEIISSWCDEKLFNISRERDIFKHKNGIEKGFKIIRIDYNVPYHEIEKEVERALNLGLTEYFSNPDMYNWLK